MYLAQELKGKEPVFFLRQSYRKEGVYCARDLINLGTNPEKFILYSGDISYEIDDDLLSQLKQKGVKVDYTELEDLFYPFLDPYIRYKLEPFRHRYRHRRWTRMSAEDRELIFSQTHVFDRRRLLFLRFGNCPPEVMEKTPTLFRQLLEKSRDELEQEIQRQEKALQPREYKNYLFSIFDLQRFFQSRLSRYMPQSLDPEKVDHVFVEQYCMLDRDAGFWQGYARSDKTPEYLLRYLIMYFDLAVEGDTLWNAGWARRGRYRRPFTGAASGNRMSLDKAAGVIGVSRKELAAMTKKEITSLYRKQAHTLHPDKGGEHDKFVELTAAYNELLRSLK